MADLDSKQGSGTPGWRFSIGYIILMFLILLAWQEAFVHLSQRSISYSEFKTALAKGEVKSVSVGRDEITGTISQASNTQTTQPVPATAARRRLNSARCLLTILDWWRNWSRRIFPIRARGRVFSLIFYLPGCSPSAWLRWRGCSNRRSGAVGESVLTFGKSRAKMVADKSTGVTFNDVAGCDEAKYELQEVVILKTSRPLQIIGSQDTQRGAAGGAAWHRQNPAGPGGRRRGPGAVFFA